MEFWLISLLRGSIIGLLTLAVLIYAGGYTYTLIVLLKHVNHAKKLSRTPTFIYISSIIIAFGFAFLWPKFAKSALDEYKRRQ